MKIEVILILKNANWTVVFLMLSSSSYAGGLGFMPLFKYSPIFGFLFGFIFLIIALVLEIKKSRKSKTK